MDKSDCIYVLVIEMLKVIRDRTTTENRENITLDTRWETVKMSLSLRIPHHIGQNVWHNLILYRCQSKHSENIIFIFCFNKNVHVKYCNEELMRTILLTYNRFVQLIVTDKDYCDLHKSQNNVSHNFCSTIYKIT